MNPQSKRQATLWLGVVFLLGSAIGSVLGYSFARSSYASTRPVLTEPERRAKRVAEMTQEIGLTGDQQQKTDAIIRSAHEEMKRIRDKADADINAVREHARDEMRGYLTDDQKPKFEEFVRKSHESRKQQIQK